MSLCKYRTLQFSGQLQPSGHHRKSHSTLYKFDHRRHTRIASDLQLGIITLCPASHLQAAESTAQTHSCSRPTPALIWTRPRSHNSLPYHTYQPTRANTHVQNLTSAPHTQQATSCANPQCPPHPHAQPLLHHPREDSPLHPHKSPNTLISLTPSPCKPTCSATPFTTCNAS